MTALFLVACLVAQGSDPVISAAKKPELPFGGTDFKQYYAASKLLVEGKNPYDAVELWRIEEPLGANEVQLPYGPPPSLLPFLPLGWLDFLTAVQVFFAVNIGLGVICCFLWGKLLFPESSVMPLAAVVALVAWVPTLLYFGIGQVTMLTLVGFTLWVFFTHQKQPVLAGMGLALSIIKPHLAAGPVLYALLVGLRHRQWRMLAAFFGTVLVLVAATLVIRPTLWAEYYSFLRYPPLEQLEQKHWVNLDPTHWKNATLDGMGRYFLDRVAVGSAKWFRVVSVAVALVMAAWVAVLAWRHPVQPANALLALTVWLVATPYAFSYDFVLLLPSFILMLGHAVRREARWWLVAATGWAVLDVFYLVIKSRGAAQGWYEVHFFIIPWGALALTLLLLPHDPRGKRETAGEAS